MQNGNIPARDLIAIPGGKLAPTPARAWLAMRYYVGRKPGGVWLRPSGPDSSYRSLAVQKRFWQLHLDGVMPQPVAIPGRSLHGLGAAVDVSGAAGQSAVRRWGADFGWGIAGNPLGSDAPSENWHAVYRGSKRLNFKARYWYFRYKAARKRAR